MSFSFGFRGDDIEDEGEIEEQDALANHISRYTISDTEKKSAAHTVQPKRHSFEELLSSLPSQISYNTLHIKSSDTTNHDPSSTDDHDNDTAITKIYRRSLFDIRAQLMTEADPSANTMDNDTDAADTLLSGLENGDLSSGVYEGGFKTWECSLDLASLIFSSLQLDMEANWKIIELGAGSAVPSLAALGEYFRRMGTAGKTQGRGSLKLTLCDYNEDVLRLATAPNVFLNRLLAEGKFSPSSEQGSEDEGDIDLEELGGEPLINNTVKEILAKRLSLDFISGAWGPEFLDLLALPPSLVSESQTQSTPPANLVILASETIYSPSSIKAFSQTLISLLRTHHQQHPSSTGSNTSMVKAWIAAKKVYFGVGGGVDEFVREIEGLGGKSKVIMETKDTGVGRVVLEVTVLKEEEESRS